MTCPKPDFYDSSWQLDNKGDLAERVERIRIFLLKALQRPHPILKSLSLRNSGAIPWLSETFRLSSFETDLLMLCAAVEMDSDIASLCAELNGDPRKYAPTLGLALTAIPEAHWSALAPSSPLRRWRLLNIVPGDQLTATPLGIDEKVLHFLAGVQVPEPQLAGFASLVTAAATHTELLRPCLRLAELMRSVPTPVIILSCPDRGAILEIVTNAANKVGASLLNGRVQDIPTTALSAATCRCLSSGSVDSLMACCCWVLMGIRNRYRKSPLS